MRKFLMLITVLFFVFFIYSCTGSGEISISFEENGGTEVEDITVSTSSTSISFPEPTREGYTFDGWYLDDALTQPFTIASLLTNTTLTLYARWTSVASTITITFEPNGGSAVAAISGVAGSSVTAPTNPTKTGFTFDGWYSDIALTTAYTFTTMPESNITLYAKWTEDIVPTKTISFETNGGSAVTAITEEVGSVVTAPTAPTRMGYSFDGWYSDVALTTSYTFSTMPSDDFTLYAKWTINNYTITFNSNDGSAVANITAAYLTAVTAPTAPTKLGHTFGGWYSDVALTTSYTFSTMPAENITLYAKWTANQYTITFNSNDGSAVASLVAAYLSTVSAPTAPTRMGYTFDGWYSDVALTTAYTFLTMPANDFTLYAKWTPTQYTIVFNENGGTAVTDITQAYLTAVTAPTAPTKLGHTFGGWYSDALLTTPYTFTTMPYLGLELFAKWTVNSYTITFEENGGTAVTDITQDYMTAVTQPTNPTKEGFVFVNWHSNIELTSSYTFATMPAENITLYAKWVYKEYAIHYVDGSNVIPPTMIKAFDPIVLIANPVRPGYDFEGWFNEELLINPFTLTVMPEEDITIYAKWSPVEFTISYETNGGSILTAIFVPYNQAIPEHGIPTKEGFVFDGWYTDIALTTPFALTVMPLGNIQLYAKWIVDDGYDMISTILNQNPSTVKVKGVLYYKFPNPMDPGFYVYDGTGFIFVLAPSTGLEVGDGIEFEGDFGYFEYVPQITNITNLLANDSFTTLPEGIVMSIGELTESSPENPLLFGQPIVISGVVQKDIGRFFLAQAAIDSRVAINYKSINPMDNPFESKLGSTITMRAIIHGVDPMMDIWHILYDPSSLIEEVVLTDQQKVDELISFGTSQLDGKEFYSSQILELPSMEPVYGASLEFVTLGDNAAYFNPTTGAFLETDTQKSITIRITVTLNAITETVDVTIILLPTEILTIAEFMLLQDMDYAMVTGIVIFSLGDFGVIFIADEDGDILAIQSDEMAYFGQRIIVHGYYAFMEGLVMMSGEKDTVLEVLEEDVPNPIAPIALTIAQFNALDVYNSLYWGKYITVSGELVFDEMTHSFLLVDELESMPIMVFNQEIYDTLSQFEGFELTLGGFVLPNFDEDPFLMFIFSGQPEDIIPNYTDQELADMLALMLQGYLEGETYIPGQIADLPTEHPVFDLTVSYSVALDDAAYIDLLTMMIDSAIDEELWISLIATITIGEASADVDIELYVKPIEILTIAEFMLLTDEDMHYVKGVILMIVEEQSTIMIADETGVLLSMTNHPFIEVGDLVLLYGAKMETPDGMIIIANDPDHIVQSILQSDQENPLTPTPISIEAFLNLSVDDPENYLTYYQVEGLLLKHTEENMFAVSDGMNQVPIFTPTPTSIAPLIPFEGQEVKLSGFSLGISDGGGNMVLIFIGYPNDVVTRYTDEELASHIALELSSMYSSKVLRPGATHKLPINYPPFEVSISYEVTGDHAALYNLETGFISDTITSETFIGITATITVGIEVEVVMFDLRVEPIETQTVAEFLAGAFDELFIIRAIVVMEQMMDGPMIIADETGHMFVVKYFDVEVGDEIIIQGYKREEEGIPLMWDEETTILLEVVSKGLPNPMSLVSHTITSYNDIDMTNMNNWGIYVEVTGYLTYIEDSYFPVLQEFIDGGEIAAIVPMYLFKEEMPNIQMMVNPIESIYIYFGYEVTVRGFLLPNFGEEDPNAPDRMLILTDPEGIEIAYQTNQEKIDALIENGEYMLSNQIFRPGEFLDLPDYIEALDISITWEFVGTNGYAIDLLTMIFEDVIDTELIDFEATMTVGDLTVTHVFTIILQPYQMIMIEDFYGLQENEYGKLQVIVSQDIGYRGYIFAEIGSSLYLHGYGFDGLNVGDEVILFGKKDQYDGFVSINGYADDAYYELLNTEVALPLYESSTLLEYLATSSTESMNLLYYYVVQGHLIYDDYTYNYYLTDGLNTIILNVSNSDLYIILDSYIGMDVEIKLFNFDYQYTGFGAMWTGLVVEGTDIITEIILTDAQKLDIMMEFMQDEMNRSFKGGLTYAFSSTHPIYGGSYQFAIDILNADLATVNGNEITFASAIENVYATVYITATMNATDLVGSYDLMIIPYDDIMNTYNPGYRGTIPLIDDTVPVGTFGGLIITEVDRESNWGGGTSMVVDLKFPFPFEIGVTYYTLQYYDSIGEVWADFMIDGYPLTTDWDNFSLRLSEGKTFRLLTDTGLVSNTASFEATNVDTYYSGWYLDMSMFLTGIMSPFVGYGLELGDVTIYNLDGNPVMSGYNVQWYRVNPYTFEEILISGATNHLYVTTSQDIGYYTMVKVFGDEINVGGMMKIYNMETVKIANYGYVTNETSMGFSIGFDYIVDIEDLSMLAVYTMSGQYIEIDSITATSNPAVFDVEVNLIHVDSIHINLVQPTYLLCQYNEFYEQIGIYVDLVG